MKKKVVVNDKIQSNYTYYLTQPIMIVERYD